MFGDYFILVFTDDELVLIKRSLVFYLTNSIFSEFEFESLNSLLDRINDKLGGK